MSTWPEPAPSTLTQPFWAAANAHKLVRQCCNRCGANFFTPQLACTTCQSEDWRWETSAGEGIIHSAAIVRRPPDPAIEAPYVLAIVTLSEGWTMLTNIVNCPPEAAKIGKKVRVNWERKAGAYTVPTFELADGASR